MTQAAASYPATPQRERTDQLMWRALALAGICVAVVVTFLITRATTHNAISRTTPVHTVVDRGANPQITGLDCRPTRVVHPC